MDGSEEADVSLVVVQKLTDPEGPQQKGVCLDAALQTWPAEAGAWLDIGRYEYHDCDHHRGDRDAGPGASAGSCV
ncbi:hypothetical protein AB5J72_02475 [Streptomyces sp. CG1]|uniref:hypothetical protein n=1 Tax=Streptomyces sp. CG1 TaxID=1287523 RepID=UPI0034E1ABE6